MLNMGDSLYEAELRKNAVVKPEPHRVAKQPSAQRLSGRRSLLSNGSRWLMIRLGDLLVAFGHQLQSRFAAESHSMS